MIGKLLMVQWAAPQLANEMMKNPQCMVSVIYLGLVEEGEVEGNLLEWLKRSGEDEEPPPHLQPQIDELREKAKKMGNDTGFLTIESSRDWAPLEFPCWFQSTIGRLFSRGNTNLEDTGTHLQERLS